MARSNIAITPGSGEVKIGTITYTRDGVEERIQLVAFGDESGNILGTDEFPFKVTLANAIKGENGALNRMMTAQWCRNERVTGSKQVKEVAGFIHGFNIDDITGEGILTIYDKIGASGSGNEILFQGTLKTDDRLKWITLNKIAETGMYFHYGTGLVASLGVSLI